CGEDWLPLFAAFCPRAGVAIRKNTSPRIACLVENDSRRRFLPKNVPRISKRLAARVRLDSHWLSRDLKCMEACACNIPPGFGESNTAVALNWKRDGSIGLPLFNPRFTYRLGGARNPVT